MARTQRRKSASPPPRDTAQERGDSSRPHLLIAWIVLAGVTAFLIASLLGFDGGDWPSHFVSPHNDPTRNWCGPVGSFAAYQLYHIFGTGIWLALLFLAGFLVQTFRGREVDQPIIRGIGVLQMTLAFSALQNAWIPSAGPFPEGGGGLLGIAAENFLYARFNHLGTNIILLVLFGIGAVVAIDYIVIHLPVVFLETIGLIKRVPVRRAIGGVVGVAGRGVSTIADLSNRGTPAVAGASAGAAAGPRVTINGRRAADESSDDTPDPTRIDPDAGGLGGTESFDPDARKRKGRKSAPIALVDSETPLESSEGKPEAAAAEAPAGAQLTLDAPAAKAAEPAPPEDPAPAIKIKEIDMDALREKIKKLPVNFAGAKQPPKPATPAQANEAADAALANVRTENYEGYKFPPIDHLIEPEYTFSERMEAFVREQAQVLEHALRTYGINGEVVGIDSGPVITLYEVQLAPGTKVAAITSIQSDIARALRAPNIRIVPNMAGKTTVGIEVPNLNKERVRLKELILAGDATTKMNLPMFLGKDASGTPLIADLSAMPHMLIAGTTGSGKSVCMNTIIMSFLYTKRPDELKLILVDPKMVEMSMFKDIPHLMCPVVTEMGRAAGILEWAVTKMEERYELLAEVGVRDIATFNKLGWAEIRERVGPMSEEEEARFPKKLPYIVFVIDELADLIMTQKEVETFIVRVAQKARAVGIHLILATQRPQANVVTGLIKSNMPCRVSFKVASGMDSRIVLDQKGAELLLGQGDMLFLSPRSSELIRAQGTLVDDAEIRKAVRFLKEVAAPSFERQLLVIRSPSQAAAAAVDENGDPTGPNLNADFGEEGRDPLFLEAVDIIVESGRGSVSLLQRRLGIGYTRSSRLIDQMGIAGIIGEHKGSVAREVILSPEEWQTMRTMMETEESETAKANSLFAGSDPRPGSSPASPTASASPAEPPVPTVLASSADPEAGDVSAPEDDDDFPPFEATGEIDDSARRSPAP